MNKIIKRIVSAVTAVAVTLTAVFVFDVPEKITAAAAGEHTHKVCANADNCPSCTHASVTWTGISTESELFSMAANGYYYLEKDITFESRVLAIGSAGTFNLCLNGHTLNANGKNKVIWITSKDNPTLNICDCSGGQTGKLTGNNANDGGSGVKIDYGTFNMYGGTISGNSGIDGGGVFVTSDGVFNMYGGTISGNIARKYDGGGVYNKGTFSMYGGTISGNAANGEYGGGVYNQWGTFTMYGGTISGNTARQGGGVYNDGTFTMNGGTISGNTVSSASGGGVHNRKTFTMNGGTISGNKFGENKSNVYLTSGKTITIGSGFSTNSPIGVTTAAAVSDCATGIDITGEVGSDISGCFTSDVDGLSVLYRDNKIQLVKHSGLSTAWSNDDTNHWHECTGCGGAGPKTEHTWNSGTVTTAATCTATGVKTYTCSVCNATKTETIAATGHSYKTTWSSDGTSHYHECSKCGDKKDTAAHSGGTATCQTKATCTVCGQKYGSLGAHNYSTAWTTSSTQHWHACLTSGCTDKSDTADHTFVQEKDGTNHWQECSVCGYKKDETAHTWGSWELTKDPTLKTTGEAERACDCGEKQTKTDVPALTDTIWTKINRTDPTLDGTGSEKYTSTDYGKVTITIPALSNETVWTNTSHKDATEEAEGEDVYESTDYGTVTVILPRLDHTHVWGDWEITKAPTLSEEGTAKRVCTKDDTHIDTKTLPVLTDNTVWTKVSGSREDPTLKDKGSEDYTSEYGTVTLPIPELSDPVWGTPTRTDPTKEAEGKDEYTSTDYGTVTVTIPKLTDPVWGTPTRTDPTKEAEGRDEYHSDIYGDVTVVIPELSNTTVWGTPTRTDPTKEAEGKDEYHSDIYGDVTVVIPELSNTDVWGTPTRTDPTKEAEGKDEYHSDTYGDVTVVIPELSNTDVWTTDDSQHVEPTEEETGKDVYKSTDYGEVEVVLPKKEHTHNWGDWSITVNPTLTATGTAKRVCTKNAEHTEIKTLPILTDTSVWTKVDGKHVDPTEDNDGKDVYTSEYGEVIVVLPALGHTHNWGDWSITVNPTLTETGTAQRVCTLNSTHIDTKTLPVLTDTSVWTKDDTQHVDPTVDNDGKDVYTSEYGEVIVVLPALGHTHNWGDWSITVNPTLTETGTAQRVCTLNNTHIDTKTLPVLTDTSVWTKDDTQHVDPTEDNDGKDVYTSEYGEVIYPLDKLPHTHKFPLTFVPEVKPTEDKEGVKEHWHCDGCGKDFEDEDGTKEVTADDLKIGKIETVVQAPANVPTPEIATPKEELVEATLTEEEQKKVDEGATIKIILKVEDATNTVQSEDKTAVTDKLGELTNYKLGQYLDVTLLKKIGEQQEQKIVNTSKPILITFEIPESLRGKSEYSVIRVHGGETTILRDLDSDPNTVTIETDKFSTYALTYKEKTSGGGSGGGGSSHRHRYIYDEMIIKEPTCTESGEKTLSCSCGQTTTETVPALGHDYHSEITKPATETENGIRTFTCTRCGDSYTELIEKTSDETSDNTPSDTSESTSGDTSDSTSSDTSDNTSSNIADSSASDNSSSGESSHIPSESDASSGDNPATGIAVSLIPLTVAVAVVIATAKRRHK